MALLHALHVASASQRWQVSAIHVHHGLSVHADAWAATCARVCARFDIPLNIRRVCVSTRARASVEESARSARYGALAAAAPASAATTVALGHHADDQAETLLLQLMRGAGAAGLAGMPRCRHAKGLAWWRPFLDVTRETIDAYVRSHTLEFVDDDSNDSRRFRRNALRHEVVPALARIAPGYPTTLSRSAALLAESAQMLDELAVLDVGAAFDGRSLACAALAGLSDPRGRNVLRWFLRGQGLRAPSQARTAAMLAQLASPRSGAGVRIAHDGVELGVYRGRIHVHPMPPPPYDVGWRGEARLTLPHGCLYFTHVQGGGDAPLLAVQHIDGRAIRVRSRRGGEHFTPDARRPQRALKGMLQATAMAPWDRAAIPLVFCDGRLIAVPGIGVDEAFRAADSAGGIALQWTACGLAPSRPTGADETTGD